MSRDSQEIVPIRSGTTPVGYSRSKLPREPISNAMLFSLGWNIPADALNDQRLRPSRCSPYDSRHECL